MKTLKTLIALLLVSAAPAFAGQDVAIKFDHMLGGSRYAEFTETTAPSGDYVFLVSHLQYYISGVFIIHDGGQRTQCKDVYLLVKPDEEDTYLLGNYEIINVEGIEFSIGVDEVRNHQDPSNYPAGHPLGHQQPSMHWGWAAGYRFCTLEGKANVSNASQGSVFQIHSVGDDLYTTVTMEVGATNQDGTLEIPIVAEYSNLLTGLDVSWGVITHGDFGEAITLMENFEEHVFSPGVLASVDEFPEMQIQVYPNPASGIVHVSVGELADVDVELYDLTGRLIASKQATAGSTSFSTQGLTAGSYYVHLRQRGALLGSRTISVVD